MKLVDVADLPDDALIVPVCMMGAPTVMTEKLPQGDELIIAFRKLGAAAGPQDRRRALRRGRRRQLHHTLRGGGSERLPLVDGDGMGRAYPELQMVTFTMHGSRQRRWWSVRRQG